jgi:hypothetical protein
MCAKKLYLQEQTADQIWLKVYDHYVKNYKIIFRSKKGHMKIELIAMIFDGRILVMMPNLSKYIIELKKFQLKFCFVFLHSR